jgi:predicted acetyltransferase
VCDAAQALAQAGFTAVSTLAGRVLTLETPSEPLQSAFREMAAEFEVEGNPRYAPDARDFSGFLARVRQDAEGRRVFPDGKIGVPTSQFWLVEAGRILGSSRLRHRLTPELEHEGGHIGYDVRPSARRTGLGTILLRLTLVRAWALGFARVRITCDADNIGSIRVIERNGGILEAEVPSVRRGVQIRRYWIEA